jgi:hypothetical protein
MAHAKFATLGALEFAIGGHGVRGEGLEPLDFVLTQSEP